MSANAGQGQVVEWADAPPRGAALHSAVGDDLEAIFAAATPRPATPSSRSPVWAMRAGRVGRVRLLTWLGAGVGLALSGVALASLVAQDRAEPETLTSIQPADDLNPGLMPDGLAAQPRPATRASAPIRVVAPRQAAVTRPARAGGCGRYRGEALARCLWPAVMQADRELRRAYDSAARNGVSRSTMVSYKNRWSSLRREARRDPERVIAGYRSMAAGLMRAQSGGRG